MASKDGRIDRRQKLQKNSSKINPARFSPRIILEQLPDLHVLPNGSVNTKLISSEFLASVSKRVASPKSHNKRLSQRLKALHRKQQHHKFMTKALLSKKTRKAPKLRRRVDSSNMAENDADISVSNGHSSTVPTLRKKHGVTKKTRRNGKSAPIVGPRRRRWEAAGMPPGTGMPGDNLTRLPPPPPYKQTALDDGDGLPVPVSALPTNISEFKQESQPSSEQPYQASPASKKCIIL